MLRLVIFARKSRLSSYYTSLQSALNRETISDVAFVNARNRSSRSHSLRSVKIHCVISTTMAMTPLGLLLSSGTSESSRFIYIAPDFELRTNGTSRKRQRRRKNISPTRSAALPIAKSDRCDDLWLNSGMQPPNCHSIVFRTSCHLSPFSSVLKFDPATRYSLWAAGDAWAIFLLLHFIRMFRGILLVIAILSSGGIWDFPGSVRRPGRLAAGIGRFDGAAADLRRL